MASPQTLARDNNGVRAVIYLYSGPWQVPVDFGTWKDRFFQVPVMNKSCFALAVFAPEVEKL